MAAIRVSPGIYKDPRTGKTVRATTQAQADRMLAGAGVGAGARQQKASAPLGATVTKNMPQQSQEVLTAGTDLSKTALGLAQEGLQGYEQYQAPDLEGERSRIEDQVYGRLTKNFDRDYTNEKNQLEQTLYNRGIPLDPKDPQYQRFMQDHNERYDTARENARARATEMGGTELSRSTGIGLDSRQQQMSEIDQLSQTGYGTKGAEYDLAYKKMLEEQRAAKEAAANQRAAIAKSGAGGAAAPAEESPFLT
jgi:hypothetical protein